MPAVAKRSDQGQSCRLLGIGVLGGADIALRRFLPAVSASNRARLAAVASRDGDNASAIAHQYGCAATGYLELLQAEQVDLVYIPLPNHLHEKWILEALRHGKHVLCEKPLALDADSAERLFVAAGASGLLLFENIMYLRHPQHDHVKELLAAGRIGTVTGLNCVFTIPGLAPGNFRLEPQQGGGAFHDLNRYPLSAARYFLRGDIREIVRCDATWQDDLLTSMEAEAYTRGGEHFTFTIAFGQPYRSFFEITGTKGTLRLDRAFTSPADHGCRLDISCSGDVETIIMPAHDHFLLTIDHVAALISGGSDFSAEHEQWRSLARTADRFLQHAQLQKGPS